MQRNLSARIEKLLKQFPIVAVIGARQVGKTTLVKQLRPDWRYIDMQKPSNQELVLADAEMFFKNYPEHVILDEAQFYLALFPVLRGVIDENRQVKGRFIITGSSSPSLLEHLSESLAGRIAIVELETLKANEIAGAPLSSFYQVFNQSVASIKPNNFVLSTPVLPKDIIDRAWFDGGYPDVVLATSSDAKQDWFEFYETTYLYRDVAALFPGINRENFQRFVRFLAHMSGNILNKAQFARDLEISESSVRNYLTISEGTFLWRNIHSLESSGYKSLVKMAKGYFADSGLLHYLSRISDIHALRANPLLGRSFEGFVIGEIIKALQTQSIGAWKTYYYRTYHGVEIDLILEGSFGLLPIEIKYGVKIEKKQLKSLQTFITERNLPLGIVINQSEHVTWLSDTIVQIPVGYL